MGDQKQSHIAVVLQFKQKVNDLGLNGHIQCCGRLIGDQKARLAGNRHGNDDTLAHAAR